MGRLTVFALALGIFLAPLGMDASEPEEDRQGHHEHPGISDAAAGGTHAHGDSDDHHDAPNTPCHHHIIHCCCSHSHVMVSGNVLGFVEFGQSQILHISEVAVLLTPAVQVHFHIPIA